jgi:hypothetical protein
MQTCAVDLPGKVVDCCILTAIYFTPDHLISAEASVLDDLLSLVFLEVKRDTINAVPLVRRSLVALALEDVSKVTSAVGQLCDRHILNQLTN